MSSWWRSLHVLSVRHPRRQRERPRRVLVLRLEQLEDRRLMAGFAIGESLGSTVVSEADTTDTFTVVLTSQPETDVVLLLTSGDTTAATVSPASLAFTSENWSLPQEVLVRGVDDPLIDGDQTTQVSVSVDPANSDDTFDAVPSQPVSVTTLDDDLAGFQISKTTAWFRRMGRQTLSPSRSRPNRTPTSF